MVWVVLALALCGAAVWGLMRLGAKQNKPSSAPAGWHPDPNGTGQRFWNGVAWTDQVREAPRISGVASSRPSSRRTTGEHRPPVPSGSPTEPWSPRTKQHEVAGEFYRLDNIVRLFRGIPIATQTGAELRHPATLVPDPGNPYDRNAVAVYVQGAHVGYLERDEARVYHHPIAARTRAGEAVTVPSRQWVRTDDGRTFARVTLSLPEPGGFAPPSTCPPEPHVILPVGGVIQVTREDQHMEALRPHLSRSGDTVEVAATLHLVTEQKARSVVETVEVRIGGACVGQLSPTQTANLKSVVDHVTSLGLTPVARATLVGNDLKADVTLHVAKAHDVDQRWLDGVRAQAQEVDVRRRSDS